MSEPGPIAKWILANRFTNPALGIFIKFLVRIGFVSPIVWMSRFYITGKKPSSSQITLMAIMPARFRGDLEALEENGFCILRLYPAWMYRVLYSAFGINATFENVFLDQDKAAVKQQHLRLAGFMQHFLPSLQEKIGFDIALSAAAHYGPAYLWGTNLSSAGIPFVIMHRECLQASPSRRKFWRDKWRQVPRYEADAIITHNQTMRQIFIDAGVLPASQVFATGALRMDDYIKKALSVRDQFPKQPQVVFFSFTHGSGQGMVVPHWSKVEPKTGFADLFEQSHGVFARFAANNRDVECIIKVKWLKDWQGRIELAARKAGIEIDAVPNLKIVETGDPQEMITNASAVCAFGSTTLLEAALAGRPVIVPLFAEALEPEFDGKVLLLEDMEDMVTARSMDEFYESIEQAVRDPKKHAMSESKARELFEKWVASTRISPVKSTSAVLDALVS